MKFVLNGCSFCANYWVASKLASQLGYNEFINLSKGGSSNRRIIRTTMDYIQKNHVDFVLLGLTFWERQESPFLRNKKNADSWVSYNAEGLQGLFAPPDAEFIFGTQRSLIEKFVKESYKFNIHLVCIDQLICDILMFSSYLSSKNIRHVFFNTCETEYTNYFENFNDTYIKSIEENKNIVPLDKFISNVYLHKLGAKFDKLETRWDVNAIHYNGDEYIHINNYLLQYIKDNGL